MKMTKIELASVELLDTKASIAVSSKNKRAARLKKAANAGGLSSLTLLVAACGGDDIVIADLGAGGLGTIVDGDILFIA